jgi:hypothetical protein
MPNGAEKSFDKNRAPHQDAYFHDFSPIFQISLKPGLTYSKTSGNLACRMQCSLYRTLSLLCSNLSNALVDGSDRAPSQPVLLIEHDRMLSFDSVTVTLVDAPSPRLTRMLSAGATGVNEFDNRSPFSFLFYSPATRYIQDLQGAAFWRCILKLP